MDRLKEFDTMTRMLDEYMNSVESDDTLVDEMLLECVIELDQLRELTEGVAAAQMNSIQASQYLSVLFTTRMALQSMIAEIKKGGDHD